MALSGLPGQDLPKGPRGEPILRLRRLSSALLLLRDAQGHPALHGPQANQAWRGMHVVCIAMCTSVHGMTGMGWKQWKRGAKSGKAHE